MSKLVRREGQGTRIKFGPRSELQVFTPQSPSFPDQLFSCEVLGEIAALEAWRSYWNVVCHAYSVDMDPRADDAAALLALLRLKRRGESWGAIAADVTYEGSASTVFDARFNDALLVSPQAVSVLEEARALVSLWRDENLEFVTVLDDLYPSRLRDIHEMPPFLFYSGELRSADDGMSVVGSRSASRQSQELAAEIARFLIAEDLTVISGLAEGIDAAAHRAALDAGGRTVAFIGTGITKFYPARNADLQREVAERGLLISQFYPDAPPTKQSFPIRNAAMSGYGLATIVVEAGEHSGTRIQARVAGDHGRPVILTSRVVDDTTWGRALVGKPNVYVASTMGEMKEAIRSVRSVPDELQRALGALAAGVA
ncbi:DNA-processing protein DprA [Microbacterium sp. Gd 4-13]|uniref:DNA-processing protein DprA n=1 Tax=Microbacterium sp. Gd 4-13 TaxID=2173179 RepID=UPI00197C2F34|nr:DNA-processing protein DprA [Microbacterium sp. Gd 4-13]